MKGMVRRLLSTTLLGGILAAMAVLIAPAPSAGAAALVVVSTSTGGCANYLSSPTDDIGTGVGMLPAAGGTVVVCPGTYNQFMVSNLTGKVTIKPAMSGPGNMPVVAALPLGGGKVIDIENSTSVTVDGLRITGANYSSTLVADAIGVEFHNSSGAVQNSIIGELSNTASFASGTYGGYGVNVTDDDANGKTSTVTIKNNTLREIDRNIILAAGQAKVTTSGNYLIASANTANVGSAGIHYDTGASGSISGNIVTQVSSGILLRGVSSISVSKNTISNTQTGIDLSTDCSGPATSSNKITGNLIVRSNIGLNIYTFDAGGCLPHADFNNISKNTMTGTGPYGYGVRIQENDPAMAEKNKITGNKFIAFSAPVNLGTTDNTTVSGNTYLP